MWIILILLLAVCAISYPRWKRKATITRWRKSLDLDTHYRNYQQLFKDVDGFALSRQARAGHDAMEYTYGEIDFISFIALLSLAKPDNNTIFCDLGSGTGKAVLACAMVFNIKKSYGIELFSTLHHAAIKQQKRLQRLSDHYSEKATRIHFIHADFLHADFSDATLIIINATAFFGETWITLNQRLKKLKPGTIIITTSKKLSTDVFILKKITTVQMSWGLVNAYIQQRIEERRAEIGQ